ncbi:MAG: GntR family transcriptional regulator [Spirochaetaceae bacterium]|jgi:GntR family transcriptional regulator|nr:GntR family transcriptional regulator [Spirochaetaceae bacterium]
MNSTISEPALSFSLDTASGIPVYRQIIQQIEYAILSGRVKSGDRLPTIRALAVDLKANPNTIAKAYNELEIRGILITQVGSGTYISDKRPEPGGDGRERKIRELTERFMGEMKALGVGRDELLPLIERHIAGGFDE